MLETILSGIGWVIYPLFSIIFGLLDLLQAVFYGLAGIGKIGFEKAQMPNGEFTGTIDSVNDGGETSTGLIYYLLSSDLVKNLFMSILILALFLIIIFTAMAFIKNAYSSKQKNWQEIVGNAFKGLANFIFIPVCCLLGVWLSNILLLAINGATSNGGSTMMSRKLFVSAAYEANLYRQNNIKNLDQDAATALQEWAIGCGLTDVKVQAGVNDADYYAEIVDRVYAETDISISDKDIVGEHYKLISINYLTVIVGGVFMLYVLVSLAYAMIKRMFILVMLFIVSPAICAMYPLDEGSAVGSWKKEFIKYTISAFGTVAAMNLFFSILPIVESIEMPQLIGWGPWFNDIFQLLIMVSGLYVVKEFMGTLSGWIGGDNAMSTGESLRKSTKGAVKKYGTDPLKKGAVKTVGAFGNMVGHIKSEGFGKGMLSSFGDTMLGQRNEKGEREGGLLRAITGGVGKNTEEIFKSAKSGYKYGKDAKENDEDRKRSKDIEKLTKQYKKEKTQDADNFMTNANNNASIWESDFNSGLITPQEKDEMIRQFYSDAEDHGVDKNIATQYLKDRTGLNQPDLERMEKAAKKAKEEQKAAENRNNSNTALANEIVNGLAPLLAATSSGSGSSTATTATVGGRTHVEDTVQERMENKLLKDVNDQLATMVTLQKEANAIEKQLSSAKENAKNSILSDGVFESRIKQQIDNGQNVNIKHVNGVVQVDNLSAMQDYNAAVKASADIQEVAEAQMKSFIDNMKKVAGSNDLAQEAVKRFEKALDKSEDAIQKLAKEIEVILKGSQQ